MLLKCGCRAIGSIVTADGTRAPFCPVHACSEIAVNQTPDLTGRKARCPYCQKTRDSEVTLPFFQSRPDAAFDGYYCGCMGWD